MRNGGSSAVGDAASVPTAIIPGASIAEAVRQRLPGDVGSVANEGGREDSRKICISGGGNRRGDCV
jgi:hypothetical protein